MSEEEQGALEALRELMTMTDESDWHLFHMNIRVGVEQGEYSKEFEAAYKAMVDELADGRGLK